MIKRIVFAILLLAIIGVCMALAISPEFCYLWQETPVLKDIYGWVDANFKTFTDEFTNGEFMFVYLSILGCLVISVFVFGFIKVTPIDPNEENYIEVTATPIIFNKGLTTIIVIEEK